MSLRTVLRSVALPARCHACKPTSLNAAIEKLDGVHGEFRVTSSWFFEHLYTAEAMRLPGIRIGGLPRGKMLKLPLVEVPFGLDLMASGLNDDGVHPRGRAEGYSS
jgi:hypothetical protein